MHIEDGTPEDQDGNMPEIPPATVVPDLASSRRNLLRFGALGGAAIITVRPGLAQAAASIQKCTIAVPDAARSTKWIKSDGSVVNKNTANSYAGPSSPLAATDIKNALNYGTSYPGYSSAQSTAYTNYIKKLTQGTAGFTCYASLQNPS